MPRIIEITTKDIFAAAANYDKAEHIAEEALEFALRRESNHLRVGASKTIRQQEYIFVLDWSEAEYYNKVTYRQYKYPIETVTLDICGRYPQPFKFLLKGFPGRIKVHAENS